RHLDRINRSLETQGLTSLPQELLFRTEQVWIDDGKWAPTPLGSDEANTSFKDPDEDGVRPGLAFYRPAPPVPERTVPGELVGSLILHRGFETSLTKWKADQGERLISEIRAGILGSGGVTGDRFAAMLAERLRIRPIRIAGDWGDVIEKVGPTGRAEFAMSAKYTGDAAFWPIGPGTKPYKRELRAVLDDANVTLQVRVVGIGRSDPEAELTFYKEELERRLELLVEKLAAFNACRKHVAEMWTRYCAPRVARQIHNGIRRRA
ncbi:hypothetical protein LPN01_18955, partial [Sphingomonas sp. A2-49]|uniref:hypothetical protein n=1 Tax=Sphingomonas sp. A2-49 TaxID=1391375 RepID=UPI0021D3434E